MTRQQTLQPVRQEPRGNGGGGMRHGGHGWMMIACCIPMLLIAIALVAAHVVSIGFLAVAIGCTAMNGADDARHGPRRRQLGT